MKTATCHSVRNVPCSNITFTRKSWGEKNLDNCTLYVVKTFVQTQYKLSENSDLDHFVTHYTEPACDGKCSDNHVIFHVFIFPRFHEWHHSVFIAQQDVVTEVLEVRQIELTHKSNNSALRSKELFIRCVRSRLCEQIRLVCVEKKPYSPYCLHTQIIHVVLISHSALFSSLCGLITERRKNETMAHRSLRC